MPCKTEERNFCGGIAGGGASLAPACACEPGSVKVLLLGGVNALSLFWVDDCLQNCVEINCLSSRKCFSDGFFAICSQ